MEFTKTSKHFDKLHLIASCVNTEKVLIANRRPITFIFVDDRYIVGTDGKMMARMDRDDILDPGYYQVVRKTKGVLFIVRSEHQDEISTYPDYMSIYEGKELKDDSRVLSGRISVDLHRISNAGPCLDIDLFKRLSDMSLDWQSDGKDRPVYFKNGTLDAVIMPINAE